MGKILIGVIGDYTISYCPDKECFTYM